jgi:hypothetical protein
VQNLRPRCPAGPPGHLAMSQAYRPGQGLLTLEVYDVSLTWDEALVKDRTLMA